MIFVVVLIHIIFALIKQSKFKQNKFGFDLICFFYDVPLALFRGEEGGFKNQKPGLLKTKPDFFI